jgi:hypothetical protein
MKTNEVVTEEWSQKYKSSINCSHPKGFGQKAHCAGKKKHNESVEMEMVCESCGMCQTHGSLNEIAKGAKDSNGYTKCWPGKHAEGTKKGKNGGQVRNCVPNESVAEGTEKRCQQCGMTNCKCKPGTCKCKPIAGWEPGKGFKKAMEEAAQKTMSRAAKGHEKYGKEGMQALAKAGRDDASEEKLDSIRDKYDRYDESMTPDQQFDMIEDMVEHLAQARGVDAEQIWEDLESFDDQTLLDESAAWHRKAGKSAKGGLNRKGVASYRAEHPGSKLQMAVTTKPSKLKPGSKSAKRRKSFCARMGGVKGPMKKPNGKPTRKALALRKWNC